MATSCAVPVCIHADRARLWGYIYREILTGLFVVGAFWPASYGLSFLQDHLALAATWFIACLSMSSFTLLNAVKVEDVNLMSALPMSLATYYFPLLMSG